MSASWEQEPTKIQIACYGENAKVQVTLMYESKELQGLLVKTEQAKAMRDL